MKPQKVIETDEDATHRGTNPGGMYPWLPTDKIIDGFMLDDRFIVFISMVSVYRDCYLGKVS